MHGRMGVSITVLLGLIFLAAFIAYPLVRWTYDFQIDYNEGWNAYHQAAAAHGNPYAHGGRYVTVNYTPLSFFVVGALTRFGDPVYIGRFLSIVCFAAIVVMTGLIARRLGASSVESAFGSIVCMGLVGALHAGYIGVDDPQLLASAVSLAGVLAYVASESRPARLALALTLFVVAVFIKQTMFVAPLAAAIDLLTRHKRRGLCFCAAGALLGSLGMASLYLMLGPTSIDQLLWPRVYSVHAAASKTFSFVKSIGGGFAAALLLLSFKPSGRNVFVVIYLAVALLSGALISGGDGAGSNAFAEVTIGLSIAFALTLRTLKELNVPAAVMAAFVVVCVYSPVLEIPYAAEQLRDGLSGSLKAAEDGFREDVAFVRANPGEAFCHSPLLSFRAGRSFFVDPFNASQGIRLHRTDPTPLLTALAQGSVAVVQLSTLQGAHSLGPPSRGGPDIQRAFESLLRERYRLVRTNYRRAFYVPR